MSYILLISTIDVLADGACTAMDTALQYCRHINELGND